MARKGSLSAMARLFLISTLLNLICHCMANADLSQRNLDDSETLLVRKERQVGSYNYNSWAQIIGSMLSWIYVIPSTNSMISNTSTLVISNQFWSTLFNIIQYATFFGWFVLLMTSYVGGVLILYVFQLAASPYTSVYSGRGFNSPLFRSFEDENMPLFDKVTSVGYGLLDRTSELYNLVQTPECMRYAMCHLAATMGDQEANGYVFKDLFRSIAATLDNKGTEAMTRSVNVGLLTGECEEPIMTCPELAPYFKKVADSVSNYL